jgi:putative ABC transport system permease protein
VLYFVRLGFKNIFRQRLRAMLALAAIAMSVVIIVAGITLARGVEKQIFLELVGEHGEVVVARQDYFDKSRLNPLRYSLAEAGELAQGLRKLEGVEAAAPRIDFGVLVESGEKNMTVRAVAVDVELFGKRSAIPRAVVAGGYLKPGVKSVLMGKTVAEELGLAPGQKVTVLGKDRHDSFSAEDFEVAGLFDLGSTAANKAIYVPVEAAQEFLALEGAASKIVVYGTSYGQAPQLAARIRGSGLLPQGVAVRTWQDDSFLATIYKNIVGMRQGLIFIICLVAGVGVLNMMMVSVLERRREIGVLMALGMSRGRIVFSFLYEAGLYGVLGSLAGAALAIPAGIYLEEVGFHVGGNKVQGMPVVIQTLRGDFSADAVVTGLMVGVLLGILGMVLPVFKTLGMTPQDAMAKH